MSLPLSVVGMLGLLHESLVRHAHPHAPGPTLVEYAIVVVATLITAYVLVRAAQMTVRPGENEPQHIKRAILEERPPACVERRGEHGESS